MSTASTFRNDIQLLRAYAVLIVLFYHAGFSQISNGYLGVDIFFVISGYLITKIIKDGIEAGNFSFSDFYFKRARRILPAAYVTIFITSLLSFLFLDPATMEEFQKQVRGAVTFTANFALQKQSGYFDGAAELKPLLHTWSLSVEEQYYLLLPLAMFLLPKRTWLCSTILAVIASFVLCIIWGQFNPSKAFFMLPSRSWELGIGSLGAFISFDKLRLMRSYQIMTYLALFCLAVLPFLNGIGKHPGISALLICVSTLIVIGANSSFLNKGFIPSKLSYVGDISYSLYLVHWPLFSLLNNAWLGNYTSLTPPFSWRISTLILSFLLAVILHKYVEQRFRYISIRKKGKYSAAILALSIFVIVVPYLPNPLRSKTVDYTEILKDSPGLSYKCTYGGNEFTPNDECITKSPPNVMVWGDSYAMHLVPGLAATMPQGMGLIQATKASCGPFIGIAPIEGEKVPEAWAKGCVEFNNSVLKYIEQTPSIEIVVLSSPLNMHLDDISTIYAVNNFDRGDKISTLTNSMKFTVDQLHSYGKKVVIVSPPPRNGADIAKCLINKETLIVSFNRQKSCNIPVASYRDFYHKELSILTELSNNYDIPIVYLSDYMCNMGECIVTMNNVFLYKDTGHLTIDGSRELFKNTSLTIDVLNKAK